MIPFLDSFIDTREKRYHLLLLLTGIVWILILIPYLHMGYSLARISSYDSLFAVLKLPVLDSANLSRLIVSVVSSANRSIPEILSTCIASARWYEIGAVLLLLLCYPIAEKKKITTVLLLLFCVEMMSIMMLVSVGLRSLSLSSAVVYIRIIGALILTIQTLVVVILLVQTRRQFHRYRKALRYHIEEIKEHTQDQN